MNSRIPKSNFCYNGATPLFKISYDLIYREIVGVKESGGIQIVKSGPLLPEKLFPIKADHLRVGIV